MTVEGEQYGRIMVAALAMKRSVYSLAEALALDIPPDTENKKDGRVQAQLEEVAAEIAAMGGDPIAVSTLESYRITALWVLGSGPEAGTFSWREGSSFTAHKRAAKGGMDYDEFAKIPRLVSDITRMLGNEAVNEHKHTLEGMTDADKQELATALAEDDLDVMTQAVVTVQTEDIKQKIKDRKGAPQPKAPSKSTVNIDRLQAVKEAISRHQNFSKIIVGRWVREIVDLGAFVTDSDWEVIEDYINNITQTFETVTERTDNGSN